MIPIAMFHSAPIRATLMAAALLAVPSAHAGLQYMIEPAHASAGDTITVRALLFNDTSSVLNWTPPPYLVLQWRDADGSALRSLSQPGVSQTPVSVPVNNFVQFAWKAIVPDGVRGMQAVNIEGSPTLLALDTTRRESSAIVDAPAVAPVLVPDARTGNNHLASPQQVAAARTSALEGPAVSAEPSGTEPDGFNSFRNAFSRHDPIYFVLGNRGGMNARFQISFRYRLFTPKDAANPDFLDGLYVGYTQTSLWDLDSASSPFVDTSYNPSLFWRRDALFQSQDRRWFLGLATGVEHKSNGRDGPESRSVNDVFVQPEFNHRFQDGSTLTFAPRLKAYFKSKGDDNPDYIDYTGRVDWNVRWAQDNGLSIRGLYRQGKHGHAAGQVDVAWPLQRTFLKMNGYLYMQYFQGYGETMLGYRERSAPQVRIGLSLIP